MKFVLVDDEEINLVVSKKLLNQVMHEPEIISFKNAGEALRYFSKGAAGATCEVVVLLDLNMPVLSGWDFLDFFQQFDDELSTAVHIYIVSSSIDPNDRTKALSYSNVIAFLPKPLTTDTIRQYFVAQTSR